MSLLGAIDRISEHEPQPFVAPLVSSEEAWMLTIQASIPYWLRADWLIRNPAEAVGWWLAQPYRFDGSYNRARRKRPAYPHERIQYLEQLPRFMVVTALEMEGNCWLVLPYNEADAAQRGWANGTPRLMHLVSGTLNPLDVVNARDAAGTLLFEGVDERLAESAQGDNLRLLFEAGEEAVAKGQARVAYTNAIGLMRQRMEEILAAQAEAEREERRKRQKELERQPEERMKYHLEFMGAHLVNWERNRQGYRVRWSFAGAEHEVTVNRHMRVVSAGICLDGTDSAHDLASIVDVMQEARRQHRHDIPRHLWI